MMTLRLYRARHCRAVELLFFYHHFKNVLAATRVNRSLLVAA